MKIEYGPPGHKGVTTIMGVGDDGLPVGSPLGEVAELMSIGAVAYAITTDNKKHARAAGWAALLLVTFGWGRRLRQR